MFCDFGLKMLIRDPFWWFIIFWRGGVGVESDINETPKGTFLRETR